MQVLGAPRPLAVRVDKLLNADAHQRLLEATILSRAEMIESSTGGRDDYRKSQLLYSPPDEAESVLTELRKRIESILHALQLSPFSASDIECQLTAHNDGDFYRVHTDNGSSEAAGRQLSYIYYFHRQPRGFSGGQLKIYDGERSLTLEAEDNTLVVFHSSLEHEVLPIRCSGGFADSRFSVNGWVWS
jgi:SM-20-related protein